MEYNSAVSIYNFRSIKELQIGGLGQFNLFIGENNCGKSSVLEALYMVTAMPQLPLFSLNSGRGASTSQNEDFLPLFNDFNIEKEISVRFEDSGHFRQVSVAAVRQERMPQVVINAMPREQSHIGRYDITVASDLHKSPYVIRYDQRVVTTEKIELTEQEVKSLANDHSVRAEYFINTHWLNYDVVGHVNNLIVNKQKAWLIEGLQKIDSRICDIQIGNNNIIYADIGLPKLMPIHFMGLGVRKFISIASILATLKNGVLLIDEFENGLHYKTMDILLNSIVSLCKEQNVQLFLTTHSYECIESFVNSTGNGNVYRIERDENGHKAITYTAEEAAEAIKLRWELR